MIDIACDLMDEIETGVVWTLLRDARDPSIIKPGAVVVAGDECAQAMVEVIQVEGEAGQGVVHLRVLPDPVG